VRATTRLMATMLNNTKVNKPVCACAAADPALLATDLADYLVKKGMPFRQAHHVVGAVVALAEKTGKPLNQLTLAELQGVNPTFGRDALGVFNLKKPIQDEVALHAFVKSQNKISKETSEIFDLQHAMAKRNFTGAPGTKEVAKQLARWRKQLS